MNRQELKFDAKEKMRQAAVNPYVVTILSLIHIQMCIRDSGMNAKMSPSAILIIQNGVTKLVNIKQQDAMTKILDMVPDFVNKFTGGSHDISPDALKVAEEMAAAEETDQE